MGCQLCGILKTPTPTRAASDVKHGPLQVKLIRLIKEFPTSKSLYSSREFKKFQVLAYKLW